MNVSEEVVMMVGWRGTTGDFGAQLWWTRKQRSLLISASNVVVQRPGAHAGSALDHLPSHTIPDAEQQAI